VKVQARITLPLDARRAIDELRARWNPERATGNPAHVTVAYHDEAPEAAVLIERVHLAAARTPPFSLEVGAAARFAPPAHGAFLTVADPARGVEAIRQLLLAPPFTRRRRFGLHVTLLHPDQGTRLDDAWPAFAALSPPGRFLVTQLEVVDADSAVLARAPLNGLPLPTSRPTPRRSP
jgi:2'-5' RNA ligase